VNNLTQNRRVDIDGSGWKGEGEGRETVGGGGSEMTGEEGCRGWWFRGTQIKKGAMEISSVRLVSWMS